MLGKQGWNFITEPQSLVFGIFKALYFPSCSYLMATLRNVGTLVDSSGSWIEKHKVRTSVCDIKMSHIGEPH